MTFQMAVQVTHNAETHRVPHIRNLATSYGSVDGVIATAYPILLDYGQSSITASKRPPSRALHSVRASGTM
jgi:hypothetical protein